jgi:hypothetical protein
MLACGVRIKFVVHITAEARGYAMLASRRMIERAVKIDVAVVARSERVNRASGLILRGMLSLSDRRKATLSGA